MFPKSDAQDQAATAARVRLMWAMGTTGKFIWPIPDKGLKKRIHRVKAPSLLIWGREDRLVPAVYADEFTRRLAGARVHMHPAHDGASVYFFAAPIVRSIACITKTLKFRSSEQKFTSLLRLSSKV